MKIELKLNGLGNIPGKKNSKKMIPAKGGRRPMLITDPKIQQTIERIERSFVSQLRSIIQTAGDATSRTVLRQSLIASLPHDDNWCVIPVIALSGQLCKKGEEGCTITIEPL